MSLFESQFDDIASVFGKQFVSDNFIDINKLNPLLYAPNHPIGNQATEVDIYNDLLELPEDSMNLEVHLTKKKLFFQFNPINIWF